MSYPSGTRSTSIDELTELVYELLDAHDDTVRLARDLPDDDPWSAHVRYLRDLQRVGRATLARVQSDAP
jgi:hypothetical protein